MNSPTPGEIRERLKTAEAAAKKYNAAVKQLKSLVKSTEVAGGYDSHRDDMAERNREASKSVREIGDIPPPVDPDRREHCRTNFRSFAEQYFPAAFVLNWSPDHLKVIAKIERAVLHGGLFAVAMPRGSGKTTLCIVASIWAMLYGHRSFVALIGAEATSAAESLEAIRIELETNPELLKDFPEVCVPIAKLEGITQRRLLHRGELVRMAFTGSDIVLPDIDGSAAAQAVVRCSGITGRIRGMMFKRSDGRTARPDLVILDDPQTDESANSPQQCDHRWRTISGAVLGLAGPGRKIAGILPCTVIRPGDIADRVLDRKLAPEWQAERTRMVYAFPTNEPLWTRYRELCDAGHRDGVGFEYGTAFYLTNRVAMDEGAIVAWPERFNPDELSAIQNAMNLKFRDEVSFFAEYQNEPLPADPGATGDPTPDEIAAKFNRRKRGVCPMGVQHVTGFIDVQERVLYWGIVGWQSDFTGFVLDYGTFPDQGRPFFTYADARQTLARTFPIEGVEALIHAGLESLVNTLCERTWPREDGASLSLERLLIDANWQSDTVYSYAAGSKYPAIVLPSHGKYVGARSTPFSEYKKRPGDRVGHHWRMPNTHGRRAVRYCLIDTNFWKTFLIERFKTGLGGIGSLSLFGDNAAAHRMIGQHCAAEFRTRTTGHGRAVDEWAMKPGKPDNHLFDVLVGSCVAASMQGATLAGTGSGPKEHGRKTAKVPSHLRR